jgi:isopentenyl diphosphate isomerase/L-lactate dehydrogenase-like FMN-dependent dehydrogenase
MKENETSFHKLMMIPRILISTSNRDMTTEVFGQKFNLPFGFGPWAMNSLSHPDGENIPARVAYENKIIYGLSTLSTKPYSEIESANKNGVRFMQMYISNDWGLTISIIRLAEKYGFTGLTITVDAQVLGIRKREK